MMLSDTGLQKNTFRYLSCPQTHKQMNRLMADNQADGLSGKLTGRFMARKGKAGKRTGKRGQRETGMGRQTDGQTVWTDRQMVILLGKAGFDEMDKQAIRLVDGHTNRQELYWDAINGRTKNEQAWHSDTEMGLGCLGPGEGRTLYLCRPSTWGRTQL